MVAGEPRGDTVVAQQTPGNPGVLRRYEINRSQDLQRPRRQVPQVAYRRGDDVQGSHIGVIIFPHWHTIQPGMVG